MVRNPEKPYIGITGITQVYEVQSIVQSFIEEGLTTEDSPHKGMIGLLASSKTLRLVTTRSKYPSITEIREIFLTTRGKAFNTLHFNTYNESGFNEELVALLGNTSLYEDHLCEGVQLNTTWPSIPQLERTKSLFPDLKIILQLGPKILGGRSIEEIILDIATRLPAYEQCIDYALIDPSGGQGNPFELKQASIVYKQVKEIHPSLPVIFAGGLQATNVTRKLQLLSEVIGGKDFGIDAEWGLRTQKKGLLNTKISTKKARRYIHNAASFFKA